MYKMPAISEEEMMPRKLDRRIVRLIVDELGQPVKAFATDGKKMQQFLAENKNMKQQLLILEEDEETF